MFVSCISNCRTPSRLCTCEEKSCRTARSSVEGFEGSCRGGIVDPAQNSNGGDVSSMSHAKTEHVGTVGALDRKTASTPPTYRRPWQKHDSSMRKTTRLGDWQTLLGPDWSKCSRAFTRTRFTACSYRHGHHIWQCWIVEGVGNAYPRSAKDKIVWNLPPG